MMFNREPALVLGLVAAVLNLAVGFGLPVTEEQLALINAFVVAVVGFWVRSKVTPTNL